MNRRHETVVLETERHRIEGTVTLPADGYRSRVSDLLNASDRGDFVSLTDATVTPLEGDEPPTAHPFLAVSRRHVVLAVMPEAQAVS